MKESHVSQGRSHRAPYVGIVRPSAPAAGGRAARAAANPPTLPGGVSVIGMPTPAAWPRCVVLADTMTSPAFAIKGWMVDRAHADLPMVQNERAGAHAAAASVMPFAAGDALSASFDADGRHP